VVHIKWTLNICTLESKTLCSTSLVHFTKTFTDQMKAPENIKELRETGKKILTLADSPWKRPLGRVPVVAYNSR
jgi:hypothetical protein